MTTGKWKHLPLTLNKNVHHNLRFTTQLVHPTLLEQQDSSRNELLVHGMHMYMKNLDCYCFHC